MTKVFCTEYHTHTCSFPEVSIYISIYYIPQHTIHKYIAIIIINCIMYSI